MVQINSQFSLRWLAWASLTKHMHSSVSLVQWIFPNHDINNTGQVFQACWGLNNTLWFKLATVHTKHKACLAWKQWKLFSLCSWVIQKLICRPMSDIKVRFVNGQFSYSDSAKVRIFSQGRLTFSSSLLKGLPSQLELNNVYLGARVFWIAGKTSELYDNISVFSLLPNRFTSVTSKKICFKRKG